MASRSLQRKVRKPKSQKHEQQRVRDKKKTGPASYFDILRNKMARRRERLSLGGRARRIIGARKFERGTALGREIARRKNRQ